MPEIGNYGVLEIAEQMQETVDIQIAPKADITLKESLEFLDNLFKDKLPEDKAETLKEEAGADKSKEVGEEDKPEKKGGSYGEVYKEGEGDKYEVHHMPADSASKLERNDGPAIKMEKEDHRQTASCGSSKEAREYRAIQKDLIEQGRFREALQMDIDDIHEKFGDKYDEAISEMMEYVNKLETEGRING